MAIHDSLNDQDTALLNFLTGPIPPTKVLPRRDAALDPLLLAAAAASGPHVTRNHYHHDFYPVMGPKAEGAWDWSKWIGDETSGGRGQKKLKYVSLQAPRRVRLQRGTLDGGKENDQPKGASDPLRSAVNSPTPPRKSRISVSTVPDTQALTPSSGVVPGAHSPIVEVKCMARTRIPTPHGPAFLHLYHNNHDNKEHLAIVIDPAQFNETSPFSAPPIRSQSLDAVWNESETGMDRILRGAYVGRLTPSSRTASKPVLRSAVTGTDLIPSPLIRIHSECFTGETVGSMRCDCGEQLDESIRLISQPIVILPSSSNCSKTTLPGRGVVVYLRQEGRGIGLLSKIRAYNLQDLGHDTVQANLMLGYKADERGYEIAGAILRDLGLGLPQGEGVRVLTNNPDKIQALEKEGVKIMGHVPMVPRSWQSRQKTSPLSQEKDDGEHIAGVTLIGGNAVHGEDLDKYIRTKVMKMGHMLPLWLEDA